MSTKYLGEVSTPLLINQIKEKCALQYSTMPTPSYDYLGKIVQYVGADTDRYFQSGFYICQHNGTNYEWVYWDAFRGKEIVTFGSLSTAKTKLATLSFPNENIVFIRDLSCYYTYTGRNSGDTEERCIFVSDTHKLVPTAINGCLPITWAGGRSGNLGHENSQLLVKAIKYAASMALVTTIPSYTYYIDEEINIASGRLCLEGVTSLGNSSTGFAMGSCIAFVPEDNSKTLFTVSNGKSTSIKHVNFYCPYTTVSGSFVEVAETPHNYFTWSYEYTDVNCLNLVSSSLYVEDVSISGFSGYGVRLPKNCTVKDVRATQCKYGFYECATDVLFHGCFARGCEYGFYWSSGTILFMYDTWIDQCGYGVYSGNELSGEFIGGEIDHCLYAGFYAKNVGSGLKIISRFGRLGMYYLGTDMKAKAEAITTYTDADFDDMSKGVDIAIKNANGLDIDVSELPRYIADNGTGTNKLPTLFAFGNRWYTAIIKTVYDFRENTYHLVDTTHNDVTVVNVNTNSDVIALPTPTSHNVGKICTLTAPQTGYQKGGIYQCVSDGAASPTYSWELISATDIIPITQAELEAMW